MTIPINLPQKANIQGFWKLNEESGNRKDESPNNNTLTDNNTVLFGAGKIGNAADFEADNSEFLSIADASQSGLEPTNNLSICAWIKAESFPDRECMLITKQNSSYAQYLFILDSSSGTPNIRWAIFRTDASSSTHVGDTGNLSAGTWYHVAVTYEYVTNGTSKMNVYLNGSSDAAEKTNAVGPIQGGNSAFQIGARNYAEFENYWDGLIDEAIVWDICLTPAEVLKVKNITSYQYGGGLGIGNPYIF